MVGDDACPTSPKHVVVDLASEQRAILVDEVWGPPSWRRERRRLARAGSGGAAAGGIGEILSSCGGCDGCSGVELGGEAGAIVGGILVVLAVALAAVILVWAIGKLIVYIQRRRAMPKPKGALLAARGASVRRSRGVIVGEAKQESPLSMEACVGWALELSSKRFVGSAVMLRDGLSQGFDVRLEDGRTARIPAGPLLLARGGDEISSSPLLASHLASIDPRYAADDPEPAIPFDRVAAVELRPGDEVELFGPLHLAPDPEAPPNYRGAAAMVLVPNAIPTIRRR